MVDKVIIIREKRGCGCGSVVIILLLAFLVFLLAPAILAVFNAADRVNVPRNKADRGSPPVESESPHQGLASMRVMVSDYTEDKPIGERGEFWIRGVGSVWLNARAVKFGSDDKDTPQRSVGYEDYVAVYPDGRESGYEILIPYKLSEGMNTNAKYILGIDITDEHVSVFGIGYENATGDLEGKWSRFSKVVPGKEAELSRKHRKSLEKSN